MVVPPLQLCMRAHTEIRNHARKRRNACICLLTNNELQKTRSDVIYICCKLSTTWIMAYAKYRVRGITVNHGHESSRFQSQ